MQISQVAIVLTMVASALADGICNTHAFGVPEFAKGGYCDFTPDTREVISLACASDSPCTADRDVCHLDPRGHRKALCHGQTTEYPPGRD
ncbi:unnamed protein product [Zymoseptoria tritici ST99CH_3D7]|uniref:Uncharacterized protein n=3 Tax=Zymoseptoria tritici TaxID=1047171 RepID=A0A1X7S3F4_ZYMT9|nr:unnamed protein product [Zymoseptoria tritici ST99CH_3D7]